MEHRYIKDYPLLYIIREDGAIFNRKGKRIKPYLNRKGYPCVKLYKEGKRKGYLVHRLVALTFVHNPHPRKWKVVLHNNDDPSDPSKDNVRWGDASLNMKDMIAKGRGKNQFQSIKKGEPCT